MKAFKKSGVTHGETSASGVSRRAFIGKTIGVSALCLSLDFCGLLRELRSASARIRQSIRVNLPQGIAVGPTGNIYATSITDEGSYKVIAFNGSGKKIGAFGKAGSRPGELNFPQGIAVDSNGDIYVVERNNGRMSVFDREGNFKRFVAALGLIYGRTYAPEGICLHHDEIFLADTRNHRIQVFDKHGDVIRVIGEMGDRDDQFRLPTSLDVTNDGLLYVVDSKHSCIKVFSAQGSFIKKFGGTSTRARERGTFNHPSGISLDANRNRVYVSDTLNDRIQIFDLEGRLVDVFDEANGHFFNRPKGMGLDGEGNVLIADTNNNQVLIIAKEEIP